VRIGIDASSVPVRPAGAGVYAIELVRALMERDPRDGYAVFARGPWFDDGAAARRNWRVERVHARSRPTRLMWEQFRLPRQAARLGLDVLHSTHHTLPQAPMHAKRVVTVHDLTFLRIPRRYPFLRRFYMRTMTELSTRVADAIIVPSRTVRDDLCRLPGVRDRRVHVVYEAAAAAYAPMLNEHAREIASRYGLDGPYLLSVGSVEPGKNRSRLVRALRALRDEGIELTLAVVGQRAWSYEEEFALVERLGMADRVRYLGYVEIDHLPALQSAADAFVFPSLYEGFGLPVLEAMACGTPVLTSNVSATAEVAGDAALLVDPSSVSSIADGVRRIVCDADLRDELSRRGLERVRTFSWRRAADETYEVYRRALEEPA